MNTLRKIICLLFLMFLLAGKSFAGTEPYENFIRGAIKKNDTLVVKDEKFRNPFFNWADITNISVKNTLSLRILDDQVHSQNFSVKMLLKVEYFSSPEQATPTILDSISLNVNYIKQKGATYRNLDQYRFADGYYVKVTIIDISSPQYGSAVPPVLQLTNHVAIDRKYLFKPHLKIGVHGEQKTAGAGIAGRSSGGEPNADNNQLKLTWSGITGGEEFDLEWTVIDEGSEWWELASAMLNNDISLPGVPETMFRNNATRVTIADNTYTITLQYNSALVAVRIRQASYNMDGIRVEGDWFYVMDAEDEYAVWELDWIEPELNWQYSATYAEEGKRKEVISYFDGGLRNRQTVTLSTAEVAERTVAVVQETIYDALGRPAGSILPAPVKEGSDTDIQTLHFFKDFNVNVSGSTYSYYDLNTGACAALPAALNTSSGAGRYYSSENDFLTTRVEDKFTKYIPNAEGYPIAVTQYTPDNTGRIKIQGGVGLAFQPNSTNNHATTNYYGKPEQWELDYIFGNDVGYAEHYLKNIVVDGNGQASLSYVNASGKTIATALTGRSPENLDSLVTARLTGKKVSKVLKPEQFRYDATALKLTATTTYLSGVIDQNATFAFDMQRLLSYHPDSEFRPCSNCHYKVTIVIKDDCSNIVREAQFTIGDTIANSSDTTLYTHLLEAVNLNKIGEYYITVELAFDKEVIDDFADVFIDSAQVAGIIRKKEQFIQDMFDRSNFKDCFADCKTAKKKLGTKLAFTAEFKAKIEAMGDTTEYYDDYIEQLYDSLEVIVNALAENCPETSSPCDTYESAMLQDVSPGGQYALIDSAGNLLEPELNVLYNKFRNAFPILSPSDTEYQNSAFYRPDSIMISPHDAAFSHADLVAYWRPEWAHKFLEFHPEYCKLEFCRENAASVAWDDRIAEVELVEDLPAVLQTTTFSNSNPIWLVADDPFFKSGSPGHIYLDSIKADLNNYSLRVLKIDTVATKSITQLADFLLYCADTTATTFTNSIATRWDNCTPNTVDNCRVPSREWQSYRDMYLDLKALYFDRVRDSTCGTCVIGKQYDVFPDVTTACEYDGPEEDSERDSALVALSGLLEDPGQNAIEMWLSSGGYGGRQFMATTPDMKYMLQACINNNILSVEIFTLNQTDSVSIDIVHTNKISANISTLLPLPVNTHLVVQGDSLSAGTLSLWLNGNQLTAVTDSLVAGCAWEITTPPLVMPENFDNILHLRLYSRLMLEDEIDSNAKSPCFLASNHTGMGWWRFNGGGSSGPGCSNTRTLAAAIQQDANTFEETDILEGVKKTWKFIAGDPEEVPAGDCAGETATPHFWTCVTVNSYDSAPVTFYNVWEVLCTESLEEVCDAPGTLLFAQAGDQPDEFFADVNISDRDVYRIYPNMSPGDFPPSLLPCSEAAETYFYECYEVIQGPHGPGIMYYNAWVVICRDMPYGEIGQRQAPKQIGLEEMSYLEDDCSEPGGGDEGCEDYFEFDVDPSSDGGMHIFYTNVGPYTRTVHTVIQGYGPGDEGSLPFVECETTTTKTFYPCLRMVMGPGPDIYQQYQNVWVVTCVNEPYGEIETRMAGKSNKAVVAKSASTDDLLREAIKVNTKPGGKGAQLFSTEISAKKSTTTILSDIKSQVIYRISKEVPKQISADLKGKQSAANFTAYEFRKQFGVRVGKDVIRYFRNVYVAMLIPEEGSAKYRELQLKMQPAKPVVKVRKIEKQSPLERAVANNTNRSANKPMAVMAAINGAKGTAVIVADHNDIIYNILQSESVSALSKGGEKIGAGAMFTSYQFKKRFAVKVTRSEVRVFKNVYVATFIPQQGSAKDREPNTMELLRKQGEKVAAKLASKGGEEIQASKFDEPLDEGVCVRIIDESYGNEPVACNGFHYNNQLRRTTVSLHDGVGSPAILAHDVVVMVRYEIYESFVFGSPLTYTEIPIVIYAGNSTGFHDYTHESWQDYDLSECFADYKTYNCVVSVSGADFCSPQVNCDGEIISPPSSTCSPLLAGKISRFPGVRNSVPSEGTEFTEASLAAMEESLLTEQLEATVGGQADKWMQALSPGLAAYPESKRNELRAKLIELSITAGDKDHPFGASTLPMSRSVMVGTTVCRSFGDVMEAVLGITTFTNTLNPWLLDSPYPYDVPPQQSERVISNTNADICAKLSALNTGSWNASDFYDQLVIKFGSAMNLTRAEFDILLKACGSCRFLLEKDIKLPVFLDEYSKNCITRAEYEGAKADLETAFDDAINTSWTNYETIAANFFNHKWGFAISYDQYAVFEDSEADQLCNEPPYTSKEEDPYACLKTVIEIAHGMGSEAYRIYIAAEREKFWNAYINVCSAAKANATLEAEQNIYHYTLYYYDVAGNLVRTVPPEGVTFLTDVELELVTASRDNAANACNYNGPETLAVKATAMQELSDVVDDDGFNAIEMWMYSDLSGNRQFISATPDKKYMLQVCQNGTLLNVDIFTLAEPTPGSISITHTNHVTADVSGILPLAPWTHIVVQGDSLATGTLEIWINGQQYTPVSGHPSAGCAWKIEHSPLLTLPDNFSALKHLRLYSGRLMDEEEIETNAASACFAASNITSISWYRFNLPDAGDPTTIASNSTVETQFSGVYPDHGLKTTYAYNSTNQVVKQHTPDAGLSKFWYDYLSRLVISQNAKQADSTDFSYTKYDELGRIIEVAQKRHGSSGLTEPVYVSTLTYDGFLTAGVNTQITQTIYDEAPDMDGVPLGLVQQNLRKRVAASLYRESETDTLYNASYYSYDLAGNVRTLYQQIKGLGVKRLDYEYDLVSGKVNFLAYQHNQPDRFYYGYKYDAENRLIEAATARIANVVSYGIGSSLDEEDKKIDATYRYYLHGPLARMELGGEETKVQGVDYAYTLQGWLKGVNGHAFGTDMGEDGVNIAKDALAYGLGYYQGDYQPIAGDALAFANSYIVQPGVKSGLDLFNGNISSSLYAIDSVNNNNTSGYTYRYDQLNRIKALNQHNFGDPWGSPNNQYSELFWYDGNGNIDSLVRWAGGNRLDSLKYGYNRVAGKLQHNKLGSVTDKSPSASPGEFKNTARYIYDQIGNLVQDTSAHITKIDWTVYGKIRKIFKDTLFNTYSYDPSGNRVSVVNGVDTTWYVRDAQGNALANYSTNKGPEPAGVYWREQNLYGSSRLGMWRPDTLTAIFDEELWSGAGKKAYELTNHLGNVMAVINDTRYLEAGVQHPTVLNAQDYFAFGGMMPERSYNLNGSYKYGFNGHENVDQIKLSGNHTTAPFWEYDTRLGRRWNTDPVVKEALSSYNAFAGNPILYSDPQGLDTLNFVNRSSSITKKGGLDGVDVKFVSPKNQRSLEIKPGDGPHVFYYTSVHTQHNDDGTQTTTTTRQQFFPIDPNGINPNGLSSNVTRTSHSLGSAPDRGMYTLAKLAPTSLIKKLASVDYRFNTAIAHQKTLNVYNVLDKVVAIAYLAEGGYRALASKRSYDIALGVHEYLDDFSHSVKANSYHTWSKGEFATDFLGIINNPNVKIHFNLKGISNPWSAVNEGAKGINKSRATSWELYQLYSNPAALERTIFYNGSKPVSNPFK